MHLKTCSNQFVQGKSCLRQAVPSKLMTAGQKSGCPKILFTMAVVTGSRHACLRYLSSIYQTLLLTFGFNLLTPDLVMTGILREFLFRFSGVKKCLRLEFQNGRSRLLWNHNVLLGRDMNCRGDDLSNRHFAEKMIC